MELKRKTASDTYVGPKTEMEPKIIFCRYSGNGQTYVARCCGKTASATTGPELAAERVAVKVMAAAGKNYFLKQINRYAYEIVEEYADKSL